MSREEALDVIRVWLTKLRDPENQERQIKGKFVVGRYVCALGLDDEISVACKEIYPILQWMSLNSGSDPIFNKFRLVKALNHFGISPKTITGMNDSLMDFSFIDIAKWVEKRIGRKVLYPKVQIKKELPNQSKQTSKELVNA